MSEHNRTSSTVPSETPRGLISKPSDAEFARRDRKRQTELATQRAELRERFRQEDAEKKRKKIILGAKALFAATILSVAAKSGGTVVDAAADPFSDAGTVAAEAITSTPNNAEQTVVDLFKRVDDEGYDSIVSGVEAEKRAHPESYADRTVANEAKQAIAESDANVDALVALDTFMSEYGIDADFTYEPFQNDTEQFKQAATAYIDVFAPLPKDLIAMSKLKRVTLSAKPRSDDSELGVYYYDDKIIELAVRSSEAPGFNWDGSDSSYQSTVAHELGHALDHRLKLASKLQDAEIAYGDEEEDDATDKLAWQNLIGRPGHVSTYSLESKVENIAELASGVLYDTSNGLADVSDTREFGSGANKYMIDMLAQLEAKRPGIAEILIANQAP